MAPMTCFLPPPPTILTGARTTPILSFSTTSSSPITPLSSTFSHDNAILNHLPTTPPTPLDNIILHTPITSILASSSETSTSFSLDNTPTILPIIVVALILGFASQSFINSMLKGDQGLSAFLQDGSGYSKSGFKPRSNNSKDGQPLSGDDPLPWLKLPQLDFVEVAGQEEMQQQQEQEEVSRIQFRLEELRQRMNEELEKGNLKEATKFKEDLEVLAKEYGFEYKEGME